VSALIRRLAAFFGILLLEPDWPAPSRRLEPPDPTPEQLAHLQGLCLQWLVMWCWYRREYAAIAKFGEKPTIIYDRDPQRLVIQCREAELAVAA
jgi:hypothetical protein